MAKRKTDGREVTITPADLARALEGLSRSILALRNLVLKLDPNTTIEISVREREPTALIFDYECPPPE